MDKTVIVLIGAGVFRTPESKKKDMEENIKVSGKRAVKVHSRGNDGVLDSDNAKIKNVHNVDE